MDDDDFRALIAELERQFIEVEAPELADEANYTFQDENTGEERLLEPRERLIAMLLAFDRYLAVRDGSIFRDAIGRIRQYTRRGGPERVSFVPIADDGTAAPLDFVNIPDLGEVRRSVAFLIEQIRAEPGPPRSRSF